MLINNEGKSPEKKQAPPLLKSSEEWHIPPMVNCLPNSFWFIPKEDLVNLKITLADSWPSLPEPAEVLVKGTNETCVREILTLCKKLTLKSPTRYLALLLGTNFLRDIDPIGNFVRAKEVAQASVLVASKMREKDIDCPLIPTIVRASKHCCTSREIKASEVALNNKFEWNYAFRTPYDYLESYLAIGCLLLGDEVSACSNKASPFSEARGSKAPLSDYDLASKNVLSAASSPKNISRNPKPSDEERKVNERDMNTPSTLLGNILVGSMAEKAQTDLRRKIRDYCLDISEELFRQSLFHPKKHRAIAYGIIAFARKANKVICFEYYYLI